MEGLAGMFKSELWERVILQACWDEEFVRDAAVASEYFLCHDPIVDVLQDSTPEDILRIRKLSPTRGTLVLVSLSSHLKKY